jgi:hypothetical protein
MDPKDIYIDQTRSQPWNSDQLNWSWQQLLSSLDHFPNSNTMNLTSSISYPSPIPLYPDSQSTPRAINHEATNRTTTYCIASLAPQNSQQSNGIDQATSSKEVLQGQPPLIQDINESCETCHNCGSQSNSATNTTILGRYRYRYLSEKQKFAVFIKVVFKVLERSNDQAMLYRAKTIVNQCTQRNRMGDSSFMPLQEAILIRLRCTVGERYWTRAKSVVVGR